MINSRYVGRCFVGLLLLGASARAQLLPTTATGAFVNESAVTRVYHVDPAGSDANGGTQAAPFRTIARGLQSAVSSKNNNVGAKVVIRAGTYREQLTVSPRAGGDTSAPLVLEAAPGATGKVIITGSDIWTGWTPSGANWTRPWPYSATDTAWGYSYERFGSNTEGPLLPPLMRRRELLWVNGLLTRQVASLANLTDGTFFIPITPPTMVIDPATGQSIPEENTGISTGTVYLRPPAGTNMSVARVEFGVRDDGLKISGRRNVVVRGLTIQNTSKRIRRGTTALWLEDGNNILVENCTFQGNNNEGLYVADTRDLTLRGVRCNFNGTLGMGINRVRNLLVEDSEASYNTWRVRWANWTDGWATCAFKTMHVHEQAWRRFVAIGNYSTGMWWDTDNSHVVAEDCFVSHNRVRGLFIENSPGPFVVRRSIIANTRATGDTGAGVRLTSTPDVTLEHNLVYNNQAQQYYIVGTISRTDNVDWETGANYGAPFTDNNGVYHPTFVDPVTGYTFDKARRHAYRNNVFVGAGANQDLYAFPNKDYFNFFYPTLVSNSNAFWNPVDTTVWDIRDRGTQNFAWWKSYTGQDAQSLWADPRFVDPGNNDFRRQTGSPIPAAWNLPTVPAGGAQIPLDAQIAFVPGAIEAENYDVGGQGVAYHDVSAGNGLGAYRTDDVDIKTTSDTNGGHAVGSFPGGEWLEYTAYVGLSGAYDLQARVGSAQNGGTFHVEANGQNITGPIRVPNLGDWDRYKTITVRNVALDAGMQVFRVVNGGPAFIDLNRLNVTPAGSGPSNNAPVVRLTNPPSDRAALLAPATIALLAAADDDDGTVNKVEFFQNGVKIGEDAAAPYLLYWSDVPAGAYALTARATDNEGAATTSEPVHVVVSDRFHARINFQPATAAVPFGYLVDGGAAYNHRGNGYTYGWNTNNTANVRDRNSALSPDQRYDTLAYMQLNGSYSWEIAVPNGTYTVRVVAGDPTAYGSVYKINVENVLTVDGTPTSANRWIEGTQTVSVIDGRLTVTSASGASNNKLCFIEITPRLRPTVPVAAVHKEVITPANPT